MEGLGVEGTQFRGQLLAESAFAVSRCFFRTGNVASANFFTSPFPSFALSEVAEGSGHALDVCFEVRLSQPSGSSIEHRRPSEVS